jgi:hypothetical protein
MSVETGRQNIIILFWKKMYYFWEYINGNQIFVLYSNWPFICSVARNNQVLGWIRVQKMYFFQNEMVVKFPEADFSVRIINDLFVRKDILTTNYQQTN